MASQKKSAPYGTWTSPITAETVSGSSIGFSEVHVNPKTGAIYLVEERPSEEGRATIVEVRESGDRDAVSKEYNVRTKIHEYGGGAVAVGSDGSIVFNDTKTHSVFVNDPAGVTSEVLAGQADGKVRYGDFDVHPQNPKIIAAIREEHQGDEVINTLAIIDASTKSARVIVQGADFYSHPRFSRDGSKFSWMQWNHPDMPWTGTELYVGNWSGEKVDNHIKIAGRAGKESISQPRWHVDNTLLFCSDRTGFWQLYQSDGKSTAAKHLRVDGFEDAETSGCEFRIGGHTYTSLDENNLAAVYCKNGSNGILLYDLATGTGKELDSGLVDIQGQCLKRVSHDTIVVKGASKDAPTGLYLMNINSPQQKKCLKRSSNAELPTSYFQPAQCIEFPRTHGEYREGSAHAIFIPPFNPDFEGPKDAKPPMIVFIHGGPTSHVSPGLALRAQYYTSRGYAYCFVNHAGSTGYGRKYRELLDYKWGLIDCDDTVSCIDYLAGEGLIDRAKVGITGGSAGGYTTLQALCSFPDVFAAGNSLYGIGNLRSLADTTHKFESHYLFALLFPPGTPIAEQDKIYNDRSPCVNVQRIKSPLLLLQGDIDRVVPLDQAVEMEKLLKDKGGDVKLVVFENEGHGFQKASNQKQAIEEEEALWKRTLL